MIRIYDNLYNGGDKMFGKFMHWACAVATVICTVYTFKLCEDWLLMTIIEFAILGVGWYCKTVGTWYGYANKPSETSES